MADVGELYFPDWLPPAIKSEAEKFRFQLRAGDKSSREFKILSKLVSDERMRGVWKRLLKRKLLSPAALAERQRKHARELRESGDKEKIQLAAKLETVAAVTEREPHWALHKTLGKQERALQIFFSQAYRNALDSKPHYVSAGSHRNLKEVAESLRRQANVLNNISENYLARKILDLAEDCEATSHAILKPLFPTDDPGVFVRRGRDDDAKAYITSLCITNENLFGVALYEIISTVISVVWSAAKGTPHEYDRETVREMLRAPRGVRRPKSA